jgi:endoglycosylceramidase
MVGCPMRPLLALTLGGLLWSLALASPATALDGRRLKVLDSRLVDQNSREITLRGVNARAEGIFDVTFDDGRLPLQPIPGFDSGDCERMRALGFNLLRLPINWSALEPAPGAYSAPYLQRIDDLVAACRSHGVLVLLDFHQDAFSKEIGQDGAPRWVLDLLLGPNGYPYLGGPLDDLTARRFAAHTLAAFRAFFENLSNVQDRFADAAIVLARRFRNNPGVVGYEIMNEPLPTLTPNGAALLDAFHLRITAAIRSVDRRHLVVFEPDTVRNLTNTAPLPAAPFPDRRAVYAPHIYTGVFDFQTYTGDAALLIPSMENAAAEAADWGTPLFIGEYGIAPEHPFANEWITTQLDLQDRLRAHSAFWVWEETSEGMWGLFDGESGQPGSERLSRTTALSRVYAQRVPGRVLEHTFDAAADTLRLRYVGRGRTNVELYVPPRRYPNGFTLACDGTTVAVAFDVVNGGVRFPCGGRGVEHLVELAPIP